MIRLIAGLILGVIMLIVVGYVFGIERGAEPDVTEAWKMVATARAADSSTKSMPYVPPSVDAKLRRDMSDIAAMLIPIQYVDGGLLSHIPKSLAVPFRMPTSTAPPETARSVVPMFRGVTDVHDVAAFGDARFGDDMIEFKPENIPVVGQTDTSVVEPFNVVDGMVVTGDASASIFEKG